MSKLKFDTLFLFVVVIRLRYESLKSESIVQNMQEAAYQ